MTHTLKTWPEYFAELGKNKRFEIRKNDRNFKEGDALNLREWDPKLGRFTGGECDAKITYVCDFPEGLKPGYVVLGLLITWFKPATVEWPQEYPTE